MTAGANPGRRSSSVVVRQVDDMGLTGHACTVGRRCAVSLAVGSLLLIRAAPQVRAAMRIRVQASTTRQPTVHSNAEVLGLRSRCKIVASCTKGRVIDASAGTSG